MISNLMKPKTVDSVMATFAKTISDLEAVAAANIAEGNKQKEVIAAAEAAKTAAEQEAAKAVTMASRLQSLLGL